MGFKGDYPGKCGDEDEGWHYYLTANQFSEFSLHLIFVQEIWAHGVRVPSGLKLRGKANASVGALGDIRPTIAP